jgi:predicted RNA-binding Zn ribbon-like protein
MPLTREGRGTGLAVAVDLVNTWDLLEAEPDLIEGLDDVRVWLTWHGLDRAADRVREVDVDRVRALRSRLDAIFDAPTEDEAVELVNGLMRDYGTPPQLERDGANWRLRSWPDESEGLASVAAFAAAGLLEGLRAYGWERFGRCAGSPCRCAFVDRTRNRSRRYCCGLCADRVAQANSRARKRRASRSRGRRDASRGS